MLPKRERSAPSRTAELSAALEDLRRLPASRPELAGPAETLAAVLEAVFRTPDPGAPPLDDGSLRAVGEAVARGVPALRAVDLPVDSGRLAARVEDILAALDKRNPAARALRRALERDPSRVEAWGRAILAGCADEAEGDWQASSLDPRLVAAIVRLAWLPPLARWSQALADTIANSGRRGGNCPLCGASPLLAEARGLEARRILRCGRCAAEWPGLRLGCNACGLDDPHQLRVLAVEGEADRYRLASCLACGSRLIIVATLAPLSPPALIVAELATIHLLTLPDPQAHGTA
jgi:FdhE protein